MLNFLICLYLRAFKISCSAELSIKKIYNLGPKVKVLNLASRLKMASQRSSADYGFSPENNKISSFENNIHWTIRSSCLRKILLFDQHIKDKKC